MKLGPGDICAILDVFGRSSFRELRLETPELKLLLSKEAGSAGGGARRGIPGSVSPPASTSKSAAPGPEPAVHAPEPEALPDEVLVRAAVMGTFYRAPSPDAPPFVAEGQAVGPGDTVGLIEVMKLFSSIPAGVAGTVSRLLAANASPVRTGQPLVAIRPTR